RWSAATSPSPPPRPGTAPGPEPRSSAANRTARGSASSTTRSSSRRRTDHLHSPDPGRDHPGADGSEQKCTVTVHFCSLVPGLILLAVVAVAPPAPAISLLP